MIQPDHHLYQPNYILFVLVILPSSIRRDVSCGHTITGLPDTCTSHILFLLPVMVSLAPVMHFLLPDIQFLVLVILQFVPFMQSLVPGTLSLYTSHFAICTVSLFFAPVVVP